MKIIKIEPYGFASNSYLITADGKTAVAVDPSEPRILDICRRNNLKCEYVILTHGHFDHVGGCAALQNTGARILCGEAEKELIFGDDYLGMFGGVSFPRFKIDDTLSDGENFSLCGIDFTAVHTPGHSAGSMCYASENNLFSGDTLFRLSVGRTDLPTGDMKAFGKSLAKIAALSAKNVYPGHGENTELDFERQNNPYLKYIC